MNVNAWQPSKRPATRSASASNRLLVSCVAEAGVATTIPFALVNQGVGTEEFTLDGIFPPTLNGTLSAADEAQKGLSRIVLAPKQSFKGLLTFTVPGNRVDGSRQSLSVKAASVKFNDLIQTKELQVTVQAPLVRAVAKFQQPTAVAGETLTYRVTVLNVGSTAARRDRSTDYFAESAETDRRRH
ncbi:MAG: hypothetical protein MZW92_37655 [Comamonadaceae bacterium]|nr:hypothetical protein [Comamonadaceae bacterium]